MKALKPHVVGLVLEMKQHRNLELLGNGVDQLHRLGVALHLELLFANPAGAHLEVLFQHRSSLREVGQLVGEVDELFRILAGQLHHRIVAPGIRRQAVAGAGRQQHRLGDAEFPLVSHQVGVAAAHVVGVLMEIDDGGPGGTGTTYQAHQGSGRRQKLPAVHGIHGQCPSARGIRAPGPSPDLPFQVPEGSGIHPMLSLVPWLVIIGQLGP